MQRIYISLFSLLIIAGLFTGCRGKQDPGYEYAPQMYHSIPLEPYTQIEGQYAAFKDSMNSQLPPEGTIPINGWIELDYTKGAMEKDRAGKELKNPIPLFPDPILQGKVLFTRFCEVCHGAQGKGDGSIPTNSGNYPPPPKYKSRTELPEGAVFHVITFGQNAMGAYASQLTPFERWQVVTYVQLLQDNLNPVEEDVSEEEVEENADENDAEPDGEGDNN